MTSTEKINLKVENKNNSTNKTKQTNMCWESRQADRQAPKKFKSEFGKIGETEKYLGMWKLKKLCMCVSLAKSMFGVNFHTEDKRRERKHKLIHTPGCKFRRRLKSVHE